MPRRAVRRIQATCLAAAVVAATGTLAISIVAPAADNFAATACAAGTPCLTATPGSDLADGQFVKLSFTGYPAQSGIGFLQCKAAPASVTADCTPVNTNVVGVTDNNGSGSTYLPVSEGNNIPNAAGGTITCDAANPCVMEGLVDTTNLTSGVAAPLVFGKSTDDCPPFPADGVLGVGSSSAFRAVYKWEFAQCGPPASIAVDYALKASPDGVFDFQHGLADFGVTGPFATPPDPTVGPPFKFAPVSASAVVLGFQMWDQNGAQITHFVLTPDLIAQIFQGTIANLAASPAIAALNPGVQFPARLVPYARAESSAQSLVFTSWLNAQAKSWTGGVQSIFPASSQGAITSKTGSAAVGFGVVDPGESPSGGQAQIGYMDSSTASFYGLPTVTIQQSDGSQVDATPAAISAALAAAPVGPDGTLSLDYAHPSPTVYPMLMPSYMMVPTAVTATMTPDRGLKLANFLRYAVQNGQGLLPNGYVPLTPTLVSNSLAVANAIPQPPPPTPTPAPSPSASSSATSTGTGPSASVTTTITATTTTTVTTGAAGAGSTLLTPFLGSLTAGAATSTATNRPGASGTACPTASASGSASTSAAARTPTPAPGLSATPAPSPPVSPHPSASATPCLASTGAGTSRTPGSALTVNPFRLDLSHIGDSTFARYALPPLLALGVLAVLGGIGLEIYVRRRRPVDTAERAPAGGGGS